MQSFLGLREPMVFFDVLLHMGTLAAVFVVYRRDIAGMLREGFTALSSGGKNIGNLPKAWLLLMIIVGSVPAAFIGLLFEDLFEELFASPFYAGLFLIVTGAFLFASRYAKKGDKTDGALTIRDALLIGLAQAMAITPGISRSGATIVAGLFLGLERETSARFSFLLSIPAIMGAMLLKAVSAPVSAGQIPEYTAGVAISFTTGLAALVWLIGLVKRGKLDRFSWYCLSLGGFVALYNIL